MKLRHLFALIACLGIALRSVACPTCASSLGDDYTPPFFSDEFYQPRNEKAVKKQENMSEEGEEHEGIETRTTTTAND